MRCGTNRITSSAPTWALTSAAWRGSKTKSGARSGCLPRWAVFRWISPGAEQTLHRGVLVVPDLVANAGGVICAAMEYRGATETQAFEAIEPGIRANVEAVMSEALGTHVVPREVGMRLASARLEEAMTYRRFGLM